jgi:hypothetical protein
MKPLFVKTPLGWINLAQITHIEGNTIYFSGDYRTSMDMPLDNLFDLMAALQEQHPELFLTLRGHRAEAAE